MDPITLESTEFEKNGLNVMVITYMTIIVEYIHNFYTNCNRYKYISLMELHLHVAYVVIKQQ